MRQQKVKVNTQDIVTVLIDMQPFLKLTMA